MHNMSVSDRSFGLYLGIEFRSNSLILSFMKNVLSGLALLSTEKFPFQGHSEDTARISDHISQHVRDVKGVFVSVPDDWAIKKYIQIPATRGRDTLDQLMSFEIERHVPFDQADMLYDFQVLEEKNKMFSLVITAVPKTKADVINEVLDKLSLKPDVITVSSLAIFNVLALSGQSPGGWRQLTGLTKSPDSLGKSGEANIILYADDDTLTTYIVMDRFCRDIKCVYLTNGQVEKQMSSIYEHISSFKKSLSLDHFDNMFLAGDVSSVSSYSKALEERLSVSVSTIDVQENVARHIKDEESLLPVSSLGALYAGLRIGSFRINLLPHKREHFSGKKPPVVTYVMAGLTLMLIIAMSVAEYASLGNYSEKIDAALNDPGSEVVKLEKLADNINLQRGHIDVLQKLRYNEIVLDVLAELSRKIPEQAWITNLQYSGLNNNKKDGAHLIMSGYADSSSILIPLLEDSQYFEQVEFVGTIKKTRDKEGFKIRARIISPPGPATVNK